MEVSVKKDKYLLMRKKLDDLKIYFTFDISNFNLIESLLDKVNDLQQDSELKTMKFEKIKSEYEKNLIYVNSLVSENDKLVLENNDLHKKMMHCKNSNIKSIEAKELEISKLNIEKNEIKLLNQGYLHKLEIMEVDLDATRKKLSSILTKIYENNIGESSLRQMFENDIKLRPLISNTSGNTKTRIDKQESISFPDDHKLIVAKSNLKMNFSIIDSVKGNKDTKNMMIDHINKTFNNNRDEQQRIIENLNNAYEEELQNLKNQNLKLKLDYEMLFNSINDSNSRFQCTKCMNLPSDKNLHLLDKNQSFNKQNPQLNSSQTNLNNNKTKLGLNNIDYNNQEDSQNARYDSPSQKDPNNYKPINSVQNSIDSHHNNKSYQVAKQVLFNDQKSEIIINYLKKEKENMEIKHRVQLTYLMDENKELKDKIQKMLKSSLLNREQKPWNNIKPESEITKKQIKEQMQKEINILKKAVLEQNDEINKLKMQIKEYRDNYILKNEVILNELKYKDINDELKGAHELIKTLENKLKNSASINNSEKVIFNNNTIDLKAELDVLKKNNFILNERMGKAKEEHNQLCDKYNTQVSICMRQTSLIEELELKIASLENKKE